MITVREYTDDDFENLLEFCRIESQEDHPSSVNMWIEKWESDCRTLPFILKFTERFKGNNGKFFIVYSDNRIIGCSGIYKSEYTNKLFIAGSRTWLAREFRNKQLLKNEILPVQKDWAITEKANIIALCFNEYNSSAIRLFRIGMKTGNRTPRHLFYSNYNEVEFPVIIQFTAQWVIYETLSNYRFDWNKIRSPSLQLLDTTKD